MRNRMYGGVRGRKMKVGGKLLHFPPTRFMLLSRHFPTFQHGEPVDALTHPLSE